MRELRIQIRPSLTYVSNKENRRAERLNFFFSCCITTPILLCGCGHFSEDIKAKSTFQTANDFFNQGSYQTALLKYKQIVEKYPSTADRVLFEMGTIYAYPENEAKDYQKSLECFRKLVKDYPGSRYRQDSEMMIFYINNVTAKYVIIDTQQRQIQTLQQEVSNKEAEIIAQQRQIEILQQEVKSQGDEIIAQQKMIEALEQKSIAPAIKKGSVDTILIQKKQRRLMLISKGEVLKTFKIALGGNPAGPKERQGDNKTPEGSYFIDARNKDSQYHLSLHISYPNEKDKKRAKELGVSPGGDIMIHGIKNGFASVGDLQSETDWTSGCIAVTNEEIEEIGRLAPNGTVVEIRP